MDGFGSRAGWLEILRNAAGIALVLIVVAILAYFLGREGSIQYRLEYREEEPRGSPIGVQEAAAFAPGGVLYVPAYSHIYVEDGQAALLTVTLSVRNVSRSHRVVLTAVDYFETRGTLLRSYLQQPVVLAPLETAAFLVKASDVAGGSGANFLVEWRRDPAGPAPLVEAVMVGKTGTGIVSFDRGAVPLSAPEGS